MPGIFEEQFDAAVQAKLNVSGGGIGPVVTRDADYSIVASEIGATIHVTTDAIRGTLAAALADGFEFKVVTNGAITSTLVQPPAGETITIPVGFGFAAAGVGQDAQALQFIGSVWFKKVGTTWLLIGINATSVAFESGPGAFANDLAAAFAGPVTGGHDGFTSWDIATAQQAPPSSPTPTTALLVSFWFFATRTPTATVSPVIMNQWRDNGGPAGANTVWSVDLYDAAGTPRLRVTFTDGDTWIYSLNFTSYSEVSSWNHALIVFDVGAHGGGFLNAPRIYINGSIPPGLQDDGSTGTPVNLAVADVPLDVGYRLDNENPPQYVSEDQQYSGRQDEIALWYTRPTTVNGAPNLGTGYDSFATFIANQGSPIDFTDPTVFTTAGDEPTVAWRFETTPMPPNGSPIGFGDNGLTDVMVGNVSLHPGFTQASAPTYQSAPPVVP